MRSIRRIAVVAVMLGMGAAVGTATALATTAAVAAPRAPYFSVPGERSFSWADSDSSPFAAGATIAIVHGLSPRAVLHAVAPHPGTPVESPARAQSWADKGPEDRLRSVVRVRSIGSGWVLLVNPLGFRVTTHAVLDRISARGSAVAMYEDVDDLASYQRAVRGRVLREFDPVLYDRPWIGHPSEAERHIRFGDQRDWHTMAKCMLLTYRRTGVRLTLEAVNQRRGAIAVGITD